MDFGRLAGREARQSAAAGARREGWHRDCWQCSGFDHPHHHSRGEMAYWNQRTVAKRVSATGIGLHSGRPATLTLAPASPDAGVTFVRMDLGVEIPARAEHV